MFYAFVPWIILYTQRCANATNILYTQRFLLKIRNSIISSFCYAHKRPSPFFLILIYPHEKKPLFNDKVWTYYQFLVSKRVKSQKTEKTVHIPPGEGEMFGVVQPNENHWEFCCGVCSKKDHSLLNNSTTCDAALCQN